MTLESNINFRSNCYQLEVDLGRGHVIDFMHLMIEIKETKTSLPILDVYSC